MKVTLLISAIMFLLSTYINVQAASIADTEQAKLEVQVKHPPAGDLIPVEDLKNDLEELVSLLESTHPDPEFTMNFAEVKSRLSKLSREITAPLSQLDTWKRFSLLNPYFGDGHMVISFPKADKHLANHLSGGGRVFPLKVRIDKSYRIYVTDIENISNGIKAGDEIVAINGMPASSVVDSILSRMHGDSINLRIALASERFAKMFWLLYGDTNHYQVDIVSGYEQSSYLIIGSDHGSNNADSKISDFVQRKILDNNIGYLKVDRFYYAPEHEQAYFNFMDESWQAFQAANVQDVIIDVRNNPGGTDHYWQRGIAPYVADKPFSFLSHFKARMTERNLKLGPIRGELGSIVEGPFNQQVPIEKHNKLRIPGKAYLLMGPSSYSSTILFLTALQDSNQAIIAGGLGGARSCTTGRIETTSLSGSNLDITLPTLIFTRPAGKEYCQTPVVPDILIEEHTLNKNAAVEQLASEIVSAR